MGCGVLNQEKEILQFRHKTEFYRSMATQWESHLKNLHQLNVPILNKQNLLPYEQAGVSEVFESDCKVARIVLRHQERLSVHHFIQMEQLAKSHQGQRQLFHQKALYFPSKAVVVHWCIQLLLGLT